jgi:hypothetical protein
MREFLHLNSELFHLKSYVFLAKGYGSILNLSQSITISNIKLRDTKYRCRFKMLIDYNYGRRGIIIMVEVEEY